MENKEFILCKYGEIVLKGLNKGQFEKALLGTVKTRLADLGEFKIYYAQSTLYIEPMSAECDIREALGRVKTVFGIATVTRALAVKKDIDEIIKYAKTYIPPFLKDAATFKVEGKRSDKSFPLTSPELAAKVGEAILEVLPTCKVNVNDPEALVRVEIREEYAFPHANAERGAGGIPYGTSGKALLLLSGGIDSPVAGYMTAKRGAYLEALHFESIPYTSQMAKEKVLTLAKKLCAYIGRVRVNIVSLTAIQEQIKRLANEDYFTLLLRRSMMRIACRVANMHRCDVLVTGESLGQVASQTMKALTVTDDAANIPVFRPCIGLDKEEIVKAARSIGTFDTSIIPYEDCCTVFTPKHPKTQPELIKVLEEEKKIDFIRLEEEALASMENRLISLY